MVDDLLRILNAAKSDFKSLLVDKTIPLETRMEWFVNYGHDFLEICISSYPYVLTAEINKYLEEGYSEAEIPYIEEILADGIAVRVGYR